MKIAPLLVASATALKTSTSANDLLAAVGQRNVTQMEALVQGLAQESISEPGWKFDKDIQDALTAIRTMFVTSIQNSLVDQHKVDQEAHNCGTKECFSKCSGDYAASRRTCEAKIGECGLIHDHHVKCRGSVYALYKDMAKKCADLHCEVPPHIDCTTEECICKDLLNCHIGEVPAESAYGKKSEDTGKLVCTASDDECVSDPKKGYGAWLSSTITKFKAAHAQWSIKHQECTDAYRKFLYADIECDGIQKKFESCMCSKSVEEEWICSNDFSQCNEKCRAIYDPEVKNLQCLERDRKIDWSATKKIECYLDVLLYDYKEEDLLKKCGTKDCINVAREQDYKDCSKVCQNIDHESVLHVRERADHGHVYVGKKGGDFFENWTEAVEIHDGDLEGWKNNETLDSAFKRMQHQGAGGYWPSVTCWDDGRVRLDSGDNNGVHKSRTFHDQYHKGDGKYACDMNGPEVFTTHRGGVKRVEEKRCTEHLDIDYQIPRWQECDPPQGAVCDADFHCKFYAQFDDTTKIGCISDCCPEGGGGCHPKVNFKSCGTDAAYKLGETYSSLKTIEFGEHTHAWAYNRCPCQFCHAEAPSYPTQPDGHGKCTGVHTMPYSNGIHQMPVSAYAAPEEPEKEPEKDEK